MFGYVKINKDEMKFKDFYVYKGVYCSLCRELGKNYGVLARMTLNYDFTFLTLLHLSIEENEPSFDNTRCPFNPLIKCKKCRGKNECFAFTSAAAMIMLYYKLLDNIRDEGFFKRIFAKFSCLFFKRRYERAKEQYPKLDKILLNMSTAQERVEMEKSSLDRCAHPSADALGKIVSMASQDDAQIEILYRIGYCLGRYVYFMDAYDDYEKDMKKNAFNPFAVNNNYESAVAVINQSAGEAVSAFYLLTPYRYKDILQNVLEKGLTNNLRVIQEKHKER